MMSNYSKFIEDIIIQCGQHRKNQANHSNEIFERHHIIPRCKGGADELYNLIDLTPREHYIAHKLLAEEYPEEEKIVCAWHFMSVIKGSLYQPTPEEYEKSRKAIIQAQGEVVYQLNENGEILGMFYSAREGARQIGTSPSHIIECCNKQRHRAKGYFWQYAKDYETNGFSHKPFQSGAKPEKAVAQYDLKGNLITTFTSLSEAGRSVGRANSSIRRCCNGETATSAGFVWKFIQ